MDLLQPQAAPKCFCNLVPLGVTMSWDEGFPGARASRPHNDGFPGARASRPHQAWHSLGCLPHLDQPWPERRGCRTGPHLLSAWPMGFPPTGWLPAASQASPVISHQGALPGFSSTGPAGPASPSRDPRASPGFPCCASQPLPRGSKGVPASLAPLRGLGGVGPRIARFQAARRSLVPAPHVRRLMRPFDTRVLQTLSLPP